MASQSDISWTMIGQAAQGARVAQIRTRMKAAAPQALVVAS
jgi:hypothetical protein